MNYLTGSSNESGMKEFTKYYGDLKDNIYQINRRFSEGYIRSVLSARDMQLDTEGNRVRVTGSVMYYDDYTGHINIKGTFLTLQ